MNFSLALTAIKRGHKMSRAGWSGIWVELAPDSDARIALHCHAATVYWTPSTEDLLADDWEPSQEDNHDELPANA